jgi:Protein of unknown function (DUF1553)/Protein of unknown function (DUF1549)/Planctomycete cytochrome C
MLQSAKESGSFPLISLSFPLTYRRFTIIFSLSIVLAGIFIFLPSSVRAQTSDQDEFFENKIRPILSSTCYGCHTGLKSGGLRLDSRRDILKGGNDGSVIVLGKPEDSLLIKAISHTHERIKMPLNGPKLDDETIENFKIWIQNGAVWPETPEEFFDGRVRPVLAKNCLPCHGAVPVGGFRLDTRENLMKGGPLGAAVVPGNADKSLLIQAVLQKHDKLKMPPGKKLSDEEIADLVEWVKNGAVWAGGALTASNDNYQITPEQKAFWSFQPLKNPAVPKVKNVSRVQTPVDNFILAKLEAKGLKPAAQASKRALIRRATYDLTGLPPTPQEVRAFLADRSPQAFAKVVDRLLASPHYGERWGRHWLDLVRYADTAGDSADYPIPQAYLYRNYVTYSFNQDKPYDEFIREQIAGDLLPAKSESEKWQHEVATGYLAIAKRFSVKPENYKYLTIDDTIDNLGKTFLGLSTACARCHDHKYDPIPSKDYYALYGILDSTRYPFAGSENINEQRDVVYRLPPENVEAALKPYNDELKPIKEKLKELEDERKSLEKAAAGEDSSTPHPVAAHPTRTIQEINKDIRELKKQRQKIRADMPELEAAFAVAEETPHDSPVLMRGDPKNKGDMVPRHFLQILGGQALSADCKTSGRLQLAQWIADPKNPLTARVMVNRIWEYHFGKGIVPTPSDFGKRGKAPSHPELLDYLATRFIESGWSIKALQRLIMLSQTYQLSSNGPKADAALDLNNDLYWKFNRQRLDAEEIRDAMLKVSGDLDSTVGTEHPFPPRADWNWTQHKPFDAVYETNRRSVYLMVQRSQRHPYLSVFDGADPNVSTPGRDSSITPLQALFAMNSKFVHERSENWAARLLDDAPDNARRLDVVFESAFARPPTVLEKKKALAYLDQSRQKMGAADVSPDLLTQETWASFLRAVLASNEFIYID